MQRVLVARDPTPALIRTATWDVLAWNRAAAVLQTDFGVLPPEHWNLLRLLFLDPRARAMHYDWEGVASFVVGAFRIDVARAGATANVGNLVDELSRMSPQFEAFWRDNDLSAHGEIVKHIRHPVLGAFACEYSSFAVDGRSDLILIIYNPATAADADKIRLLVNATPSPPRNLKSSPRM